MTKVSTIRFDLNKFLNNLQLKKRYINKLKTKVFVLNDIKEKNYKTLNFDFFSKNKHLIKDEHLIMYIIDIVFSQTNTLLHVMDFSGKLKFFCSAGFLKYKGKRKKSRFSVFKALYRILVLKLTFLKSKPVALHLKNVGVGLEKFFIIRRLKKKFFIKIVRSFNLYSHNGCRKKKVRRKKFKKRKKRRNG